jgi:hypothetical protein
MFKLPVQSLLTVYVPVNVGVRSKPPALIVVLPKSFPAPSNVMTPASPKGNGEQESRERGPGMFLVRGQRKLRVDYSRNSRRPRGRWEFLRP